MTFFLLSYSTFSLQIKLHDWSSKSASVFQTTYKIVSKLFLVKQQIWLKLNVLNVALEQHLNWHNSIVICAAPHAMMLLKGKIQSLLSFYKADNEVPQSGFVHLQALSAIPFGLLAGVIWSTTTTIEWCTVILWHPKNRRGWYEHLLWKKHPWKKNSVP